MSTKILHNILGNGCSQQQNVQQKFSLLRNGSILVEKIDERLAVADDGIFDLADKDRMIAAVEHNPCVPVSHRDPDHSVFQLKT